MTEPICKSRTCRFIIPKKALNSVSFDFMPNEITRLDWTIRFREICLRFKAINRMGDLNPEVTTTGTVIYNGHNIYSPRTDTVELRKEIGGGFPAA